MSRVVVVLPFVPVTAITGMVDVDPGGYSMSTIGAADVARRALGGVRVHPDAGGGVHLDDHRAVLAERHGDVRREHVDARRCRARRRPPPSRTPSRCRGASRPCGRWRCRRSRGWRSRAGTRARRRGHAVQRAARARQELLGLLVHRQVREDLRVAAPRRGSRLAASISSRTVRVPSPITCAGTRSAHATTLPFTTSTRWSRPSAKCSTTTRRP